MKLIPLTQGKFAKVDDEDYDYLMQWKWHASGSKGNYYAMRKDYYLGRQKPKCIPMHRLVMGDPIGMLVDHKSGDTLDNQKNNLRPCTHAQNIYNSPGYGETGFIGVYYVRKKYIEAKISKGGVRYFIGLFPTLEDAARARDKKATELFGEFAKLNFPLI